MLCILNIGTVPMLYISNVGTAPMFCILDVEMWKTTFGGRRPLVEDDLQWKTTFGGRQPSVEDDLLEEDLRWILACCLVRFAAFFPKGLKCLSLSNISLNCLLTRHPRL